MKGCDEVVMDERIEERECEEQNCDKTNKREKERQVVVW